MNKGLFLFLSPLLTFLEWAELGVLEKKGSKQLGKKNLLDAIDEACTSELLIEELTLIFMPDLLGTQGRRFSSQTAVRNWGGR